MAAAGSAGMEMEHEAGMGAGLGLGVTLYPMGQLLWLEGGSVPAPCGDTAVPSHRSC